MNTRSPSSERRQGRRKIGKPSPESSLSAGAVGRAARSNTARINESARGIEAEVVRFQTGDRTIDFNIDITGETVWATQQQIADLFGKDVRTISEHIVDLLEEGEFDESVIRTAADGKAYNIKHYDLDVILAVGHRVKSPNATAFRKWAYRVLRSYLTEGYALNERRLRDDPGAADDLAARLRAIRSEEKHIFAKVREYFKEASSDYDGSASSCRAFYALLQDKFHYAASGMTACQLIFSRADHRTSNMGMTTFDGDLPTVGEAKVGKNYLSADELDVLHIVSEQFLLHVMSKALRKKVMTMIELVGKFDALLRINGYEVLAGYANDYQRPCANKHAIAEYARFMVRRRQISTR